jgi:hypothetical protein
MRIKRTAVRIHSRAPACLPLDGDGRLLKIRSPDFGKIVIRRSHQNTSQERHLRKLTTLAYGTAALLFMAVLSPPVAHAYRSCAEAIAAGAAPLYAGQPGYSRALDRDGDGVACETGGGGRLPLPEVGAPGATVAPLAPSTVAPSGPPIATGPTTGAAVVYTTVVHWTGADCIEITAPNEAAGGVLQTGSYCGGAARFFISPTTPDQMVGADPVMGSARSASCEILTNLLKDSGTAGDGHDINCLTRADAVPR